MNIREYRSFVIVIHDELGCLLLKSSNTKKKKNSFQLPGGRLDYSDLKNKNILDYKELELDDKVFKIGAARELFEETGLDYRNKLDKLKLLNFDLPKKWKFFLLNISSNDSLLKSNYDTCLEEYFYKIKKSLIALFGFDKLVRCLNYPNFYLRLSSEHQEFIFEKNLMKASELLRFHSKGMCSKALIKYLKEKIK